MDQIYNIRQAQSNPGPKLSMPTAAPIELGGEFAKNFSGHLLSFIRLRLHQTPPSSNILISFDTMVIVKTSIFLSSSITDYI